MRDETGNQSAQVESFGLSSGFSDCLSLGDTWLKTSEPNQLLTEETLTVKLAKR